MNLFNSSSIYITPNGTKAGKLYAVKPTDGSGDLTVTRATSATRVNASGVIETVGANVPRLDYSNGSCPSILVEPQRTNVITNSNDFSNANWTDDGTTTKTPNSGISPDGTQNAIKITSNGGYNYKILPVLSAGTYTYSIYVKASASVNINIVINDIGGSGVTTKNIAVTTNWQRFNITKNVTLGTFVVIDYSSLQSGFDFYFYGAQLEAGANATSYIPTTSASVTRNADVISKTGISSLIGQTEGTLFLDFVFKTPPLDICGPIGISSADNTNRIGFWNNYTFNSIAIFLRANGINLFNTSVSSLVDGTRYKLAVSYKSGDIRVYLNGTLTNTFTNTFTFSNDISVLYNASYESTSNVHQRTNQITLWKTALTNTQLSELTTI